MYVGLMAPAGWRNDEALVSMTGVHNLDFGVWAPRQPWVCGPQTWIHHPSRTAPVVWGGADFVWALMRLEGFKTWHLPFQPSNMAWLVVYSTASPRVVLCLILKQWNLVASLISQFLPAYVPLPIIMLANWAVAVCSQHQ